MLFHRIGWNKAYRLFFGCNLQNERTRLGLGANLETPHFRKKTSGALKPSEPEFELNLKICFFL